MKDLNSDWPNERFFHYFLEIAKIPHGSGNTKGIADYLVNFANERGLFCIRDTSDNVLIRKSASEGYENSPGVIIQGHTDMVAVKTSDSKKDLTRDGIDVYADGDFLRADGTSLGGDDGIAVAYALALLEDNTIKHPTIEALFTSDEEIGLLGAAAFDKSVLTGRILLNVDSDDEGIFTAGCAGGVRTDSTLKVTRTKAPIHGKKYKLTVSGLLGGHSGVEIDRGRANAIKVGFEILAALGDTYVAEAAGGVADNAIPTDFFAKFITYTEGAEDIALTLSKEIKERYKESDPNISIELKNEEFDTPPCDRESSEKIVKLGCGAPYGITAMNPHIEGLVETSSNCGIVRLADEEFTLCVSVRSSKSEEKRALAERIKNTANSVGAEYSERGDYPGWAYKSESALRDTACRVYREMYGKEAKVVTIHAGLECGLFSDAIEGLDCISFGPDNYDIHTTDEHLSISSSVRVFEFIKRVLEELK